MPGALACATIRESQPAFAELLDLRPVGGGGVGENASERSGRPIEEDPCGPVRGQAWTVLDPTPLVGAIDPYYRRLLRHNGGMSQDQMSVLHEVMRHVIIDGVSDILGYSTATLGRKGS